VIGVLTNEIEMGYFMNSKNCPGTDNSYHTERDLVPGKCHCFPQYGEQYGNDPLIVPLAMPMVAGPSAMTMVILSSTLLGKKFLTAIERLMGMILTTMAIQMLLTGIKDFMG